jgi:predicted transport protein
MVWTRPGGIATVYSASFKLDARKIDGARKLGRGLVSSLSPGFSLGYRDLRVTLTTINELPYLMGLVRQSFERQMGNGSEG